MPTREEAWTVDCSEYGGLVIYLSLSLLAAPPELPPASIPGRPPRTESNLSRAKVRIFFREDSIGSKGFKAKRKKRSKTDWDLCQKKAQYRKKLAACCWLFAACCLMLDACCLMLDAWLGMGFSWVGMGWASERNGMESNHKEIRPIVLGEKRERERVSTRIERGCIGQRSKKEKIRGKQRLRQAEWRGVA